MKGDKALAIDLFCGRGGWTKGFLAEGYDVIGFDLERHACYPGQLVLQDVLTLEGRQFRGATVIVASPPCQAYSYRAMPWKRAKALPPPDNTLFEKCFEIARDAGCPVVVENVCGAQKWVGRARARYGSFFLWGDVPALLPSTVAAQKFNPDGTNHSQGSWFKIADSKDRGSRKNNGGSWFNVAHGQRIPGDNAGSPVRGMNEYATAGIKQPGLSGPLWFDNGAAHHSSRSSARKEASAIIAEIPFELSSWIARCFLSRA